MQVLTEARPPAGGLPFWFAPDEAYLATMFPRTAETSSATSGRRASAPRFSAQSRPQRLVIRLLTSWGAGGWDDLEMTTQLNEHLAFCRGRQTGGRRFPAAGRGRAGEAVRKFGDETVTEERLANPQVQERPENTKLLYIL